MSEKQTKSKKRKNEVLEPHLNLKKSIGNAECRFNPCTEPGCNFKHSIDQGADKSRDKEPRDRINCNHCKKMGHKDIDCWQLHPERKPQHKDKQ